MTQEKKALGVQYRAADKLYISYFKQTRLQQMGTMFLIISKWGPG